jgi:hypothetical protein
MEWIIFSYLLLSSQFGMKVEYDGSRLLQAVKVDDENDVHPPPVFNAIF